MINTFFLFEKFILLFNKNGLYIYCKKMIIFIVIFILIILFFFLRHKINVIIIYFIVSDL